MHRFTRVEFSRFKAFKSFTVDLRQFNIMVGPNNAGKSTIISGFRILAAAMRKAISRKPAIVKGPQGAVYGYEVELKTISVAEENIFFDYDETQPASIKFHISNGNKLLLYFPEQGACFLIAETVGKAVTSPASFKANFDCPIGFVPILGPVEHNEPLYEKEAARLALFSYRAARNFRNIWHHYPDKFEEFRASLLETWPGMDIEKPEPTNHDKKFYLYMFCPEKRKPREIFWSGFGFQVWCQMLTHLIQNKDASIFLIDEPDIYLHSELQRQLLGLLRNLGPDILLATHSTEIILEAEPDDIVLVSKERSRTKRIKNPSQLQEAFSLVGSNANPILTQLAKTKRVLFVEGKDFQIVSKFARKLGFQNVANRRDFAVVPVEGFNPERIKNLKQGMEETLGSEIVTAAILDCDYRSQSECAHIRAACEKFCDFVTIHNRKELENFLLVGPAIDRSLDQRALDSKIRGGREIVYTPEADAILTDFAEKQKSYLFGQFQSSSRQFEKSASPGTADSTIAEKCHQEFEARWSKESERLAMIPGKDALAHLNAAVQNKFGVNVTPTSIIENMHLDEIPTEMKELIALLDTFSRKRVSDDE